MDVQPQTGAATLWTMRKGGRQLDAEIGADNHQWELRFLAQGVIFTWRRFTRRASAVAYADLIQQDLEVDLWH